MHGYGGGEVSHPARQSGDGGGPVRSFAVLLRGAGVRSELRGRMEYVSRDGRLQEQGSAGRGVLPVYGSSAGLRAVYGLARPGVEDHGVAYDFERCRFKDVDLDEWSSGDVLYGI